jgi:AAA family ATP:ADP antiporter
MAVGSGPNTIPWLFFGTFMTMLVATPIFGWVASRYPRRQFLPWVYLFFISNIVIFWIVFSLAVDSGSDHVWLGRIFFVWLSVFNLFVVSVFWSFMADIYTREQGRRLFGVIAAGGSIGALIGGAATSILVTRIGFQNLFPIAATLLLIAISCITRLRTWVEQSTSQDVVETAASAKPLGGNPFSGITHVFSSKYFTGIAISSVIASLLGTALYIFMAQLVEQAIPGTDEQTQFFSNINIWTNGLSLIGQLLLVKHVVHRFGIGVSLSMVPIVSVAGFILLAVEPTLAIVALLTVVRRGLGFGFGKPTSDMLYSVVTPEEKYKTKNFIETAVYRAGDLVGSLAIRGLVAVGLGLSAVSVVMLPFAALWAAVSLWLGRDYRRQARILKDSGVT